MTQPLLDLNYSIILNNITCSKCIIKKEAINSSAIKMEVQFSADVYLNKGACVINVNVSDKCSYNISNGININSKSK